MVTPFTDGEVDLKQLTALLRWQIEQGINGLVPCGTTGEAPTLSWEERLDIVALCVKTAAGRVPIVAGTGTNSTETTIAFSTAAEACGADVALIVTPYYNKPSQEGIFRHFEAIAAKVRIPIIVYNVPARTGVDLSEATLERLAQIPTIVGIKDATGDVNRLSSLPAVLRRRFIFLSGHDATSFGFNTMGGRGTISVVSNVVPRLCVEMHDACRQGDHHTVRAIHHRLRPLIAALELESNPVPVKYAVSLALGLSPDVRLPLTSVRPETETAIREAMLALSESVPGVTQSRPVPASPAPWRP
ncbi:4-hydroxy-tetrahydrodipicolinate synthase [Mesorhizobium huakuii]|uniref:4-hydroxy-tetrahydrodipicolinate synthase n=1 Tax=Mesorhizobium huakuii TaxID=28104 RepID=UPI0024E101F9|nr:4-hydroxy-tetrahydrodipicolinate synthase [Mesorhizobium huakuii]